MINLLPPEKIKQVFHDYLSRRRLVAVGLFLSLVIIILILLATAYVLIKADAVALERALQAERSAVSSAESEELKSRVTDLKQRSGIILEAISPSLELSFLLERIINQLPEGVKITQFNYERVGVDEVNLRLEGFSDWRQNLLDFVAILDGDDVFTTIESPVSNLIKDRASPFVIIINIHDPI